MRFDQVGPAVDLSDIPFPTKFLSLKEGVSAEAVDALVDAKHLERHWVRMIVPTRTLERRRAEKRPLTLGEADGILRLIRVRLHAIRVFENPALADEWLTTENPSLAGEKPIEMAVSDVGAREVESALGRIEHGIFA